MVATIPGDLGSFFATDNGLITGVVGLFVVFELLLPPVNFLANLRNGEIDRDNVVPLFSLF